MIVDIVTLILAMPIRIFAFFVGSFGTIISRNGEIVEDVGDWLFKLSDKID